MNTVIVTAAKARAKAAVAGLTASPSNAHRSAIAAASTAIAGATSTPIAIESAHAVPASAASRGCGRRANTSDQTKSASCAL